MKTLRHIAVLVLAAIVSLPAAAVTDKEMEEARAITAKAYLRYVNNGSGYLDEVTAKSMSELTPKLKEKEKENLKAFNKVAVPKDYANWDKAKLVEFWSVTFFTSPALDANGKGARPRVKKQISEMNVSAPKSKEEAKPAEEPKAAETPVPAPAEPVQEAPAVEQSAEAPTAAEAAAEQETILNDQQAIEKDAEEAAESSVPKGNNQTWVYIVVLVILIGLIIWLVVYAASLMKRQPDGKDERDEDDENGDLREQARKAISRKNEELNDVRERLRAEEAKVADLGLEIERLKRDLRRAEDETSRLRAENRGLRAEAEAAATAAVRREPETVRTRRAPEPAPEPARRPAVVEKPEPTREKQILKVIYLGRANARGIFVRADRRINAGNTIYRLDTNDGLVGTFHVVDEPEVVDVALSNPVEYLGNGCVGEDLEDTRGVSRIITESAGTAIFENNYWRILRKTHIRYE